MDLVKEDVTLVETSGLFDKWWYLDRYKDVVKLGVGAAEHYVRWGAMLLRDPGPQFSTRRYLETNPEVAESGVNALVHYVTIGKAEGRACFPASTIGSGAPAEFTTAKPGSVKAVQRDMQLIGQSSLFDAEFYLETYEDVRTRGVDPLLHYVKHGAREGRLPNPYFVTRSYRDIFMGNASEVNPLVHYLTTPDSDTFRTSAHFDGHFYTLRYPDVALSGRKPLDHYLELGLHEGRQTTFETVMRAAVRGIIDCRSRRCTVAIPVYNAHDATLDCIHSVLRHTHFGDADSLLIIDDGSTDPAIRGMLDSFSSIDGITVVHNPSNIGYTQTINRVLGLVGTEDVVLLNSDTVVSPHWLRNLKATAYRGDRIGTVTAVSDNAGAFSVPRVGTNNLPTGIDVDMAARAVAACALEPIEVPTGNGFCIYIKRALIDAIGVFDEANFPQGYGEENDFCMRALKAGWANMVDLTTYIHHVRSASFGDRKQELARSGGARVRQLHPQYEGVPAAINRSPLLASARYRISRQLQALSRNARKPKPRIMFVISTRTGGTPQTNADLMRAVADTYDCYALCCDRRTIEVLTVTQSDYRVIERYPLTSPIQFAAHASNEYDDIVKSVLMRWAIDCLHIRHLAWHSLNLVDIAKSLDVPVIHSFHDYYAISPCVNLVDDDGVYVPTGPAGHARNPLWRNDPTVTERTSEYLQSWQRRMQQVLLQCDAFVTTCRSARDVLIHALPELAARLDDFHVMPHGRDFDGFRQLADGSDIVEDQPMRILLPGNIGIQKGMHLIQAVRQLDTRGKLEFHLLGKHDPYLAGKVIDHGAYQRSEFAHLVSDIRPHIATVLSIWPETYCHTLTESWACGIPVVGIDLGAVGERIGRHGGGWLIDHPTAPEDLYAEFMRIRASARERRAKADEVLHWQQNYGRSNTTARMASQYLSLYRSVIRRSRQLERSSIGRTALVLGQPLPESTSDEWRGIRRCTTWLRREFGQQVDLVDWSALLRMEAAAWSIVVVQAGIIPAHRKADVMASLGEMADRRVFELAAALETFAQIDTPGNPVTARPPLVPLT